MTTEQRRRRRFTEAFKREQVEHIERGEKTIARVSREYEVKADNVGKWLKKYGRQREEAERIVIGSKADFDRMAKLEKEYESLQVLFGEQQVQLIRLQKLLELAKKELGSDFEKKAGSRY